MSTLTQSPYPPKQVKTINNLKLTKLTFTLTFTKDTRLPRFIGNTIRGALGQALYTHYPHVFKQIFKVESSISVPNPIIISVLYPSKALYTAGETLSFHITLPGIASTFEDSVIGAASHMLNGKLASTQLTRHQQAYSLEWTDEGAKHLPPCENLMVNFLTPTEILVNGQPPTQLDFSTFIDRVFTRISGAIDNYTQHEFLVPYSLVSNKPHIRAQCNLKPAILQTSNQPILGFIGTVQYSGDLTRYLPYVDLCSQLNVGKKTSRGCGEYSFEIG